MNVTLTTHCPSNCSRAIRIAWFHCVRPFDMAGWLNRTSGRCPASSATGRTPNWAGSGRDLVVLAWFSAVGPGVVPSRAEHHLTCWLPKGASSTTVAGVELSPPRISSSRDHKVSTGLVFLRQSATGASVAKSRRGGASSGAYSSIGQSPRLITGLFLVRTQVGPLREACSGNRMVRSPWKRDDRSTN